MFALLLANLAFAGKPADVSAIDWYKSSAYDALSAVGTDKFGSAISKAEMRCDDRIPGCAGNNSRLREMDEKARAEAQAKSELIEPDDEATVADNGGQAQGGGYNIQQAMYYVDRPTGIEYVGSYARPPAPWTGVEVVRIKESFPHAEKVCVMKDGSPISFGQEVPFAESHEKGKSVFSCPAAVVRSGLPLFVPVGSVIQIASFDIERQVFVIDHVYICNKVPNSSERIESRLAVGCGMVR